MSKDKTFVFYYHSNSISNSNSYSPCKIELELPADTKFAFVAHGLDYIKYIHDDVNNVWTIIKDPDGSYYQKLVSIQGKAHVALKQFCDLLFISIQNVTFPESYCITNEELNKKYDLNKYTILYFDREHKCCIVEKIKKACSTSSFIVDHVSISYNYEFMDYFFTQSRICHNAFPGSLSTPDIAEIVYSKNKEATKIYQNFLKCIKYQNGQKSINYDRTLIHECIYDEAVYKRFINDNKLSHPNRYNLVNYTINYDSEVGMYAKVYNELKQVNIKL